ncbi:MAG: fumarylacetoacetate hydrolase family protein [Actinomycetota bacterium]|nr:fumarylacetoacetate hydrolase family protein [Actinomycetota bacterium]
MARSDPEIIAALGEQLEAWRASLRGGALRVGWKIGLNVPDVQRELGLYESVIGNLTSASQLQDGFTFSQGDAADLRIEPEVALHIGAGGSVAAYGAAIEIVDPGSPPPAAAGIVAANIFHRAFLLGPPRPALPPEGATAEVRVGGESRASGEAPEDFAGVVELVARQLDDAGERLEEGDVIIAGSLTPPQPVQAGDEVEVELSGLGTLSVSIAG